MKYDALVQLAEILEVSRVRAVLHLRCPAVLELKNWTTEECASPRLVGEHRVPFSKLQSTEPGLLVKAITSKRSGVIDAALPLVCTP